MSHYRVTIPRRYPVGTPGHADPGSRQGHYADALTPEAAARVVRERLGLAASEPVDVQPWDADPIGRVPAVRIG